jgi:hypothetical protein
MSSHRENESGPVKTEILNVRLSEELMETIKVFCASNDMAVEKFAADALSEKLSCWKK